MATATAHAVWTLLDPEHWPDPSAAAQLGRSLAARCLSHAALASRVAGREAEVSVQVAAALVLDRELALTALGGPPEAGALARLQQCASTCRTAWSVRQTARLELATSEAGGLVAQALIEGLHRRLEAIAMLELPALGGDGESGQAAALAVEVLTMAAGLFVIDADLPGLTSCSAAKLCLEVPTPLYRGLLPGLADLFERTAESDPELLPSIPPQPPPGVQSQDASPRGVGARQIGRYVVETALEPDPALSFRSFHAALQLPVALALCGELDAALEARVRGDIAQITGLEHPGIARPVDVEVIDGETVLVTELPEGRFLDELIAESGLPPPSVGFDLMHQLLTAVAAAHRLGVLHLGISTRRILVTPAGKTKIYGFGVAAAIAAGRVPVDTHFAAPEIGASGGVGEQASDVYSLGMVLRQLLTEGLTQEPATAPLADLEQALAAVLAVEPGLRPQSCEEFASLLHRVASDSLRTQPRAAPPALKVVSSTEPESRMLCLRGGCARPGNWRCVYRDFDGVECRTSWCEDHAVFIDGTPYCSRHAAVARALAASAGTSWPIRERPAVNDRAMPLASALGDRLNRDLSEALRRSHPGATAATLVADASVRRVRSETGEHSWERSWALLNGADCLSRVDLRVTPGPPEAIELRLDGRVLLRSRPSWLDTDRRGPADPDVETQFVAEALRLVQMELLAHPIDFSRSDSPAPASAPISASAPIAASAVNPELLTDFILRLRASPASSSPVAMAEILGLPRAILEARLTELAGSGWIDEQGAPAGPGRLRLAEVLKFGTRYLGPAPVAAEEYRSRLQAWGPSPAAGEVAAALAAFSLPRGKLEELTEAMRGPANIVIQGSRARDRRSLCGSLAALLPAAVVIPVAIEVGGEVLTIFDPAHHRLLPDQPDDPRWRGIRAPRLVVRSGERLDPVFDPLNRTYQAPPQTLAAAGMLAIELERGATPASRAVLPDLTARALEVVLEASQRDALLPAGGLTIVLAEHAADLWLTAIDLARVSCTIDLQ